MLPHVIKAEMLAMSSYNIYQKPDDMDPEELRVCCRKYKKSLIFLLAKSFSALLFLYLSIKISLLFLPLFLVFAFLSLYHSISIRCPVCGYAVTVSALRGIIGLVFSKCPRCGFSLAKYDKKSRFH